MNLEDIIKRKIPPAPWAEGENIPWDEPSFSKRMLAEHLNQEHSLASRRFEIVDRQVSWIHDEVLAGRRTKILELTCGPGLYTSRLAKRGHDCLGIDYAPEAIRYARETAEREGLSCTYRLEDVRTAEYGNGFGLAMMISGQINVFRRREAQAILEKAHSALEPEGSLLLEPQRFSTVEMTGRAENSWRSFGTGGLFSERPHLLLKESSWDPEKQAATERYFTMDAGTGEVTRCALTSEAYTEGQFRDILTQAGFGDIRFFPCLVGDEEPEEGEPVNFAVVAEKRETHGK